MGLFNCCGGEITVGNYPKIKLKSSTEDHSLYPINLPMKCSETKKNKKKRLLFN